MVDLLWQNRHETTQTGAQQLAPDQSSARWLVVNESSPSTVLVGKQEMIVQIKAENSMNSRIDWEWINNQTQQSENTIGGHNERSYFRSSYFIGLKTPINVHYHHRITGWLDVSATTTTTTTGLVLATISNSQRVCEWIFGLWSHTHTSVATLCRLTNLCWWGSLYPHFCCLASGVRFIAASCQTVNWTVVSQLLYIWARLICC